MAVETNHMRKRTELVNALARGGFTDVLFLDYDSAERVLTPKRRELLDRVKNEDIKSVRGLSKQVGRDKAAVSRDLDVLFQYDIIKYERDGNRKIPIPKHETVLVEPIF
ncbi:transcriptional regulator [Haladaptatus sp. DFWS20]|uniref:HVO_A0114 family putative DNA-binding protein n=1 Tax=Haladaptatus sp. DFWS20 TaxID=3403467 RepID=UPI003EBB0FC4